MSQGVWPSQESEAVVLGSQVSVKDPERFAMLINESDFRWGEFINLAMEHRVQGLLTSTLNPYKDVMPIGIRRLLDVASRYTAERAALVADEIKMLFHVFNQ